ncbi:MAG TPA: DUF4426 domain-containing protein [Rhodanobacteraceae bacterium]|nr:DUF4426 domain-containing protein [Rhodanobacteraceae bacterium]
MTRVRIRGLHFIGALVLALSLLPAAARADSQRSGDFIVYYSAISSTLITPAVARANDLGRGRDIGLINIAVKRGRDPASAAPVAATISGSVRNLSGQSTTLHFRAVSEPGAVYYLAEFPVSGIDTLRFDLRVQPVRGSVIPVSFSRDFNTD